MASLYKISNDILRIFNDVEVGEGEITDDQYDALQIKQEELKEKLTNYVKAIKSWEVDEKALKDEKKRFNDRQTVFKNRIERLKNAALEAVLTFGEHGKSNMFIELPEFRLFSRQSTAIEIDEARVNIFLSEFERYVRELVGQGIIYTGEDVDLQGILDCINANVKAEKGDDFEPFTLTDLTTMRISVNTTMSIYELFRKGGDALSQYAKTPFNTTISNETVKDDWKTAISVAKQQETSMPTIAKEVVNQSLQIK